MSLLDLPRLLPEDIAGLEAYAAPEERFPVKLNANEYPYAPDPSVLEETIKAMAGVELNRYPDPASTELRKAFADRFGCRVENVMAGNGSDELIGFLIWALRGSRGNERPVMVLPAPTFAMYSIGAKAAGYEVHEVPLESDLAPDVEAMVRVLGEKNPNIVFISNPNNPTGTFYTKEQINTIRRATTGLVVVDEAYGDFSEEASLAPEAASDGNLAVLRTLSKVGGAALRCGFLVACSELLHEVNKIRFPFNVSRYSQVAGAVFLRQYESFRVQVKAVINERERLAVELKNMGLRVFPSRGNFLLVNCGGQEGDLWRFLKEGGIVVKFLSRLPVAGDCLRVTVGTPGENHLFMERVIEFLTQGGTDAKR